MPVTSYDFTLTVVAPSKTASSDIKIARNIHNFGVKCGVALKYKYEFTDKEAFPIFGDSRQKTGPSSSPVNRRCIGFKFTLFGADPGVYNIRVMAD